MTGVVPCQTPMTQSPVRAWKNYNLHLPKQPQTDKWQRPCGLEKEDQVDLLSSIFFSWVPEILLPQSHEYLGLQASSILPGHRCNLAAYKFCRQVIESPSLFFIFKRGVGWTRPFILYTIKCPVPGKYWMLRKYWLDRWTSKCRRIVIGIKWDEGSKAFVTVMSHIKYSV